VTIQVVTATPRLLLHPPIFQLFRRPPLSWLAARSGEIDAASFIADLAASGIADSLTKATDPAT